MKTPACAWTGASRGQRSRGVRSAALAALLGAALLFGPALAQQSKSGGGALGPAAGSVGGGASGAANVGGAAGVSNPSPGGTASNQGGPGQTSGPRSTETSRPGYLGGRVGGTDGSTPSDPDPGTDEVVTIVDYEQVSASDSRSRQTLTEYSVAHFGNCAEDLLPSTPQQRMSRSNNGRIEAVAHYLSRHGNAKGSTARYLVANIQEELEKPKPDLVLIGTYFGVAARRTVTPALVEDVSASLCAPVAGRAAEEIAQVAENQRAKLRQDRMHERRSR